MKQVLFVVAAVLVMASFIQAQESPYAGQEARDIKALSEEDVRGYMAGEGMGFAKAAELNNYPGPRHVLDLSDELGLSEKQIDEAQAIYDEMHAEAVEIGSELVEKERELDSLFAGRAIDEQTLKSVLDEIISLTGRLRYVHLSAHLRLTPALSHSQIALYNELRGYSDGGGHGHHGTSH